MFKSSNLLWSGCVQAVGKLASFTHSLSTKTTAGTLNVFKATSLHTVFRLISTSPFHSLNYQINRSISDSFHIIHLAYNYNYLYINKGLEGLTK